MKKVFILIAIIVFCSFYIYIFIKEEKPAIESNNINNYSHVEKGQVSSLDILPNEKLKTHAQGYLRLLNEKAFYNADNRNQKIIAVNAMLQYDGFDYDDLQQEGEHITVFSNIYNDKNLTYQLGIKYNKEGFMELNTLQILYMTNNKSISYIIK